MALIRYILSIRHDHRFPHYQSRLKNVGCGPTFGEGPRGIAPPPRIFKWNAVLGLLWRGTRPTKEVPGVIWEKVFFGKQRTKIVGHFGVVIGELGRCEM